MKLAYFRAAHRLNYELDDLFGKNQLTLTRQVTCHPSSNATVDILLAINGLPGATIELKNPTTGQNWRHAVKQYEQRDFRAPLFKFKNRALVHFAADTDEIHMTTRLAGERTYFLPFNRGSHPGQIQCGKGNPVHSFGYRTGYFWEEVLRMDSFIEIIGSFMFLEKKEEKVDDGKGGSKFITKETLVFPRYHQLDSTRKLIIEARKERAGHNYLIQHSAGSGKTNSISWLSHRLASLHDSKDEKVFDCVIVITDRKVLDKQLQDAIYQIEHQQGVVKAIDNDSKQLAEALIDGTKIVITTLQKFPWVLKGLLHAAGAGNEEEIDGEKRTKAKEWEAAIASRKYAVIVDEAHSSQTGEAAREMKAILGDSGSNDEEEDWEDRLNRVMESRGQQSNISFFAFTATPKGKTLETFGRKNHEGKAEAFHTYSMRQAIEECFILDVLKRYTSYDTWFKLVSQAESDPELSKKKAARALAKFVTLHPHNIAQKTEVIIEHFRTKVMALLGHRAKAMVVTSSRLHAVRYKLAFEEYLKDHHYTDVRPLVAFSGSVKDPETNEEYTEPSMNKDVVTGKTISESQLPERFATPDYQVLLVANKYQTGFDQPLLCAMYVDKRLDGVQAVQTLSRLNRKILGKEDPFVLDFVNDRETIYTALKPYYDSTSLQEASDPAQLDTLKHELDGYQIYHWSEVEAFSRIFYKPIAKQTPADHAHMQRHLQPAVDRFKAIEAEEGREKFRKKLQGYVNVYAFLSQILPYADRELEMLYSFGKLLIPHLPLDREDAVNLGDEIALKYYRLQRVDSGAISLNDGDPQGVKSPTDVGSAKAKDEKSPLSEIIEALNERFGTEFSEKERLFFEQIQVTAAGNSKMIGTALSNSFDKFELGSDKTMDDLIMALLSENDDLATRYMDGGDFKALVRPMLMKGIYKTIHANAGKVNVEAVVAAGESNTVEFKSTLRVNLHTTQNDPKMEHTVLKTIAAFLNSKEGGTLVVGVDDNGTALGIETDKFPNEDKMDLHLGNLIKCKLGSSSMLNIKPHFETFQDKRVLVVDCAPSGSAVYLKNGASEEFFIRAGASTASLQPSEMTDYIVQRFS